MPNPATVADLTARFPELVFDEATAQVKLEDAWDMLLDRRPALEQNITDGLLTHRAAVRVACGMVARVLRNPEGWSKEAVDDWQGERDASTASGELYVSDDELRSLTLPASRGRRSMRLTIYGSDV